MPQEVRGQRTVWYYQPFGLIYTYYTSNEQKSKTVAITKIFLMFHLKHFSVCFPIIGFFICFPLLTQIDPPPSSDWPGDISAFQHIWGNFMAKKCIFTLSSASWSTSLLQATYVTWRLLITNYFPCPFSKVKFFQKQHDETPITIFGYKSLISWDICEFKLKSPYSEVQVISNQFD